MDQKAISQLVSYIAAPYRRSNRKKKKISGLHSAYMKEMCWSHINNKITITTKHRDNREHIFITNSPTNNQLSSLTPYSVKRTLGIFICSYFHRIQIVKPLLGKLSPDVNMTKSSSTKSDRNYSFRLQNVPLIPELSCCH